MKANISGFEIKLQKSCFSNVTLDLSALLLCFGKFFRTQNPKKCALGSVELAVFLQDRNAFSMSFLCPVIYTDSRYRSVVSLPLSDIPMTEKSLS